MSKQEILKLLGGNVQVPESSQVACRGFWCTSRRIDEQSKIYLSRDWNRIMSQERPDTFISSLLDDNVDRTVVLNQPTMSAFNAEANKATWETSHK